MSDQKSITAQQLADLRQETFLRDLFCFDEIDSTNTRALALISENDCANTPLLVYAESQLAGRGRGANRWWSQQGSLTFSVIVDMLELGLSPEQQPQLSLLTGLSVLKAGQEAVPRGNFAVKWPNDVYLSDRKLAGILIEIPPKSAHLAVIGVGVNVNNSFDNATEELKETGISLSDLSGQPHSRVALLKSFLRHLEDCLLSLSQGGNPLQDWSDYCLLGGKRVTVQAGPRTICGVCLGIDEVGALRLETETGAQNLVGGVVKSWE